MAVNCQRTGSSTVWRRGPRRRLMRWSDTGATTADASTPTISRLEAVRLTSMTTGSSGPTGSTSAAVSVPPRDLPSRHPEHPLGPFVGPSGGAGRYRVDVQL